MWYIDDPMAALVEVAMTIGLNPVKVLWNDNVFGRNSDAQFYIYMSDLLEIISGNQELNIAVMHGSAPCSRNLLPTLNK